MENFIHTWTGDKHVFEVGLKHFFLTTCSLTLSLNCQKLLGFVHKQRSDYLIHIFCNLMLRIIFFIQKYLFMILSLTDFSSVRVLFFFSRFSSTTCKSNSQKQSSFFQSLLPHSGSTLDNFKWELGYLKLYFSQNLLLKLIFIDISR